jgi:hypothetical protein
VYDFNSSLKKIKILQRNKFSSSYNPIMSSAS